MSIVNADPKGRVVLVWPDKVLVLNRCDIVCARIAGGDVQIKTGHSIGDGVYGDSEASAIGWINVTISLGAQEGTAPEFEARIRAVYESIVAEDDDIVWTRIAGGWIRVPDTRNQ